MPLHVNETTCINTARQAGRASAAPNCQTDGTFSTYKASNSSGDMRLHTIRHAHLMQLSVFVQQCHHYSIAKHTHVTHMSRKCMPYVCKCEQRKAVACTQATPLITQAADCQDQMHTLVHQHPHSETCACCILASLAYVSPPLASLVLSA